MANYNIYRLTVYNYLIAKKCKGEIMVILFSPRKSEHEKEIIEILTDFGGNYISEREVNCQNGKFTVISEYKNTELKINKGIAVIADDTDRFENQIFPKGIIGICESENKNEIRKNQMKLS